MSNNQDENKTSQGSFGWTAPRADYSFWQATNKSSPPGEPSLFAQAAAARKEAERKSQAPGCNKG